ncbi:MAG: cytochrome c oxidase subunit 3 [Chitinophagaceae bacterium]
MTFILIISSVTMVLAVKAGHDMNKKESSNQLNLDYYWWYCILMLVKLGSGLILHHEGAWWGANPFLNADGTASSSNFTNYFFTITGFHGFHVLSGVVINIVMLIMTLNDTFEKRGHYLMIEKAGLYWHFVDLVWVFVFTCFYLI